MSLLAHQCWCARVHHYFRPSPTPPPPPCLLQRPPHHLHPHLLPTSSRTYLYAISITGVSSLMHLTRMWRGYKICCLLSCLYDITHDQPVAVPRRELRF